MVMDIHYKVLTIMSESYNSIKADSHENLSGDELKVMDEVEFTSVEVREFKTKGAYIVNTS